MKADEQLAPMASLSSVGTATTAAGAATAGAAAGEGGGLDAAMGGGEVLPAMGMLLASALGTAAVAFVMVVPLLLLMSTTALWLRSAAPSLRLILPSSVQPLQTTRALPDDICEEACGSTNESTSWSGSIVHDLLAVKLLLSQVERPPRDLACKTRFHMTSAQITAW